MKPLATGPRTPAGRALAGRVESSQEPVNLLPRGFGAILPLKINDLHLVDHEHMIIGGKINTRVDHSPIAIRL